MFSRARRHAARLLTIAVIAAGGVLLAQGSAWAHVRVIGNVIPGQPATLQFRVPSELTDATTVRLNLVVPPELRVTAVPPVDGWTEQTVAGANGQPTRLTWTARSGHEIQPAASAIFPVQVGPIPDVYAVTFDAEQVYSNGTIATWNQKQTGPKEPDFPSPVLVVNPSAKPAAASGAGSTAPSVTATSADSAGAGQAGPSAGPLAAIGGGVLVVGGLVTTVLLRRRRGAT
ncbi:DUF1775 domain-containing protein [Pseudonocardia acaciae]|uniref:DUF1775 domain-containing protein n=1 Tax=Pseudonocardia acaciae TaxID=551276 RepID=UPI00048EF9D4|nr:DUF1775 domain-containing protein [Pseudonocardia acaciae]